jgi:hypothetical protein
MTQFAAGLAGAVANKKPPVELNRRVWRIGGDYIVFVFFFFLPFALDFVIAALGSVVAVGAVASDPDFAAAPPLVPLAPPVCAKAPAADKASATAATGMISARIINSFLMNAGRKDRPF